MGNIKGFTVVLDQDYKQEDANIIATAIGMIKGVQLVTDVKVDNNDYINRIHIQREITNKIYDALKE